MSFAVEVIADSISPDGVRLTTFKATFPRFILAEVNTHRMLSRNSASSRAIPTEKLIERVRNDPFVPMTFNKRVAGMGVGDELEELDRANAEHYWREAADAAAAFAYELMETGLDKSRANRLLEPFLWHTAIISATEWDNFFALRDHEAAQPEFRTLAQMMRAAMDASEPTPLKYGDWHTPMLDVSEARTLFLAGKLGTGLDEFLHACKLVSAGRLARVSFDTHDNFEPHEKSIERAEMLMGNGHWSPFEHVARPLTSKTGEVDVNNEEGLEPATGYYASFDPSKLFVGNFRGWVQMRREIPNEHNFGLMEAA